MKNETEKEYPGGVLRFDEATGKFMVGERVVRYFDVLYVYLPTPDGLMPYETRVIYSVDKRVWFKDFNEPAAQYVGHYCSFL